MEITKEQQEKMKKLGLGNLLKFKSDCMLCGKELTAKTIEELNEIRKKHIDNDCNSARWIKFCTKEFGCKTMKDIVKVMKKFGVI